jgi:competence protein CoiA
MCALLQERFPEGKWAKERTIPENKQKGIPKLEPDISGRINGIRVAIEVQASTLTIRKIVQRARDYTARKIALLWVVPLTEPLGDLAFRPRLYERYLHSIYFGRTYYWWEGLGLNLKPVHYAPASRHVEYREWYEDGELVSGGGYDATYKIIKQPDYGPDINLADGFVSHLRPEFTPENERKAVPQCLIWRDRLPEWWNTRWPRN